MLEPGVYQEWLHGKLNYDAVIIVGQQDFGTHTGHVMVGAAWRVSPDAPWRGPWVDESKNYGAFHPDTLTPHPDGDALWAEYCASLLT